MWGEEYNRRKQKRREEEFKKDKDAEYYNNRRVGEKWRQTIEVSKEVWITKGKNSRRHKTNKWKDVWENFKGTEKIEQWEEKAELKLKTCK